MTAKYNGVRKPSTAWNPIRQRHAYISDKTPDEFKVPFHIFPRRVPLRIAAETSKNASMKRRDFAAILRFGMKARIVDKWCFLPFDHDGKFLGMYRTIVAK